TWSVTANTSTSQRTGTLTIAGKSFTVTQAGSTSCTYSISPTSASPASAAGSGTVTVTAGTGCSWTAASSATSWLTCTPASGSGNGSVTWSATANTSTSSRTGTVTIQGKTDTVTQAGTSSTGGALVTGVPFNDSLTAATSQSGWKYYYLDVPAGSSSLVVALNNMTADMDLYVRYNAQPTLSVWACRPYVGGTSEQCTFSSPAAGRWWIGVNNYDTGTISYTVKATSAQSSTDTTVPTVPSGLTASAASSSQVNLSWSAATDTGGSGLAGYKIYRSGVQIGTSTTTSYSNTGLSASTSYCYTMAAYDNAGNTSAKGTQACATTPAGTDTTAPSVPSGLVASAASSGQINLSWSAATDTGGSGLAGYKIYRSGVQIGTSTTTSYSNTGLSAGTSYCYTVAAYDNAGNTSAKSTQACATPSATTDTTVPSVPSGLVANAASSSQINLSWSAATDTGGSGLGGYKIYRSGVQIGTSTTTSYSNTGLSAGTSYCYTVAAYDNAGNTSAQGTQACATPQASVDTVPPTVSLTSPSGGSTVSGTITLGATSSDNVGVARVEFYRDGSTLVGTDTGAAYAVGFETSSLVSGSSHYFQAKAYDMAGNWTMSSANNVTVNNSSTAGPWAKGLGSTGADVGLGVAVDSSGNIISAGYFQGSVDFGGGVPLTSAGGVDLFIAKYTAAGVHVWSKRFGATGNEMVSSIALDASGNIFLGGSFTGTGNFG